MANRPDYPVIADAKWAGPLIVAALVCALAAARVDGDAAMFLWGVASVLSLAGATWWITRHERLSRLMAKNPAWEGVAVIDESAKRGRRRCTVMLRNGRAWRWTIDADAAPDTDGPIELRVRVWARRLDVVARTTDRTLWPIGVVRKMRDGSHGYARQSRVD
jgi:hypothetical protein